METDDDLMLRFQSRRDFGAFERLFGRHKDVLFRFILRLLGARASAEDACQHTWLRVIEVARRGAYCARDGATFRTWLFALARNHVIDEHHRKSAATRTVPLTEDLHPEALARLSDTAMDPISDLARGELVDRILDALALLPTEQREVMALWVSGIDPADIAVMTSAPRETVLSRKKYALAKLRKSLSELATSEHHE